MTKNKKIEIANLIKTQIVDKGELTDEVISQIKQATIPHSGPADTVLGEMLRAHQYIEYRYRNSNDQLDSKGKHSIGSLLETSWKYIANKFCGCARRINQGAVNVENETKYYLGNGDTYKRNLERILDNIIEFAIIHPQVFDDNNIDSKFNTDDGWVMDVVDMEEDYDYYINYVNGNYLR